MSTLPLLSSTVDFGVAFFDEAPFPLWIKSVETGIVLQANRVAEEIFGPMVGRKSCDYLRPEDAARSMQYEAELLATGRQNSQWLYLRGSMCYATRFLMKREGRTVIAGAAAIFM